VLRDNLYLIKVNSVRKTVVLNKNNKVRVGAIAAFSEENEATIAKITWLSRKESMKAYGLIVVYITKGTNA
jgi:preprotein translocase subunit SecE